MTGKLRRLTAAIGIRVVLEVGVHQSSVIAVPVDLDRQAEQVVLGGGHLEVLLGQRDEIRLGDHLDKSAQEPMFGRVEVRPAQVPTQHCHRFGRAARIKQ